MYTVLILLKVPRYVFMPSLKAFCFWAVHMSVRVYDHVPKFVNAISYKLPVRI